MAPRSSATFAKRQKERARQEKQQAKLQRKLQRKTEKQTSQPGSDLDSMIEFAPPSEPITDNNPAAAETAITEREIQ